MRWKVRPVCQQCEEEIETDFFYAMVEGEERETAVCEECMDKMKKRIRGTYLGDAICDMLDEKIVSTEKYTIWCDVIETSFADLYL